MIGGQQQAVVPNSLFIGETEPFLTCRVGAGGADGDTTARFEADLP